MTKFKLRTGRLKAKGFTFNIIRDGDAGVFELLKDKVSLDELSELIYLFFAEVRETILNEKFGFEMPLHIGSLQISGVKEQAYKLGNAPRKLNKAVINPNYHTNGYVYRLLFKYNNNLNSKRELVAEFPNAWLYSFTATDTMRDIMCKKIKAGQWQHWPRYDHRTERLAKTYNVVARKARQRESKTKANDDTKDNQ